MQSGSNPGAMFGAGQASVNGLAGLLQSIFSNPSAPYQAGMGQLQQYLQQMQGMQNPFMQAGQGAIGNYQGMLGNMSNPSQFLNNLMGQYQQSPYAAYETQQAQRAGNNAASASGLLGSTPFLQQSQQNAGNIASQDQQQWLQNALGINNQALQGYGNLINVGQNATNNLMNQYGMYGQDMGQLAYGEQNAQNANMGQGIMGGLNFLFG